MGGRLGPGRIFWAAPPGPRGDGKIRPMIVATRRTELLRTGQLVAVVCSTAFDEGDILPSEVVLPHHPSRPCSTGLSRPTVAVCDWTAEFQVDDIDETGGIVPGYLLKDICEKAGLAFPSER